MSNKWLWCLEILRVKHKLRYTSQLIWQTHIPLTHSLTRTHTRTIEHSATSIPSPSRFYPLPPFPKQQVYQDTIKNYHSTQKCKHMKCRSMYLSWLNSVAISLKLERAWLSVKSMKKRKKIALPNVIPRNQTCTAFLPSTLCVCVWSYFIDSVHASKDIHLYIAYVSYCDKYFIWRCIQV